MTSHLGGDAVAEDGRRLPGGALAGTGTLIRFILRRDRVRIPVWVLAIAGFVVMTAASFPGLYPTADARQARAELMANPAATALAGPGHGMDDYTFGAMLTNEMLGFTAIFVALMSVLMVVRHTRTEEETGRAELVRAGPVGRYATTTAALAVAVAVNLLLGGALAVGLGSLGLEGVTWPGSVLFGASLAAVGVVFAGAAVLAAQVTEHARAASGMAGAAMAVAYTLRAAGDMGGGALSWLSPFGWAQATRAYVDERWWPLLLAAGLTAVLVAVALRLGTRRDVDAGLVRPRPGPAGASRTLAGPLGLAVRLHRSGLIWWAVGLFAFGAVYGMLATEVERFVEEIPAVEEMLAEIEGASVLDSWLALVLSLLAIAGGIYGLQATMRMRTEESAGRAEPMLAAAVSRTRWAASHVAVAMAGSVALLLAAALGLGSTAAISLGDASLLPSLLGAAFGYVPAVWVVVGLVMALFGLLPRAAAAAWVVVVYALAIGMLGGLLGLPEWTYDLSPFAYLPLLPAEDPTVGPPLVLAAIAAALIAVGMAAFRRRDLATTA